MKNRKKKICGWLAAMATFVLLMAGSAMAADTVDRVTLNVESTLDTGDESGDIKVTTSTAYCTVADYEITNDNGNWKVGDRPRVKITVETDEEHTFASIGKNKVTVKGVSADVSSCTRKDSRKTLEITIILAKLDGNLELENVEWKDDSTPTAIWDDNNGAQKYQVRLYRDGSSVGDTETVSKKTYDFLSSITKTGEYTFKVRSVGNSKKGDWYESDSLYVDEDDLTALKKKAAAQKSSSSSTSSNNTSSTSKNNNTTTSTTEKGSDGIVTPGGSSGASGSWQKDETGWWFRFADGSYPKNGWLQVDGAWYCFDSRGYIRTGWIRADNGDYYYCETKAGSTQGALLFNQKTPDGYWVNEKGIWVPGA